MIKDYVEEQSKSPVTEKINLIRIRQFFGLQIGGPLEDVRQSTEEDGLVPTPFLMTLLLNVSTEQSSGAFTITSLSGPTLHFLIGEVTCTPSSDIKSFFVTARVLTSLVFEREDGSKGI